MTNNFTSVFATQIIQQKKRANRKVTTTNISFNKFKNKTLNQSLEISDISQFWISLKSDNEYVIQYLRDQIKDHVPNNTFILDTSTH